MNRLANATSPYLLQHAGNPVDWYPWGDEALGRARAEGKPILLSVGYAACHWCHVMERESFTDPETARLMNDWFVSVKVDREELPDVDAVYMAAVQAMTGHGGWPMTVFLTPEGKPFYGGTYFPPEPRHGLPAFRQLLATINEAWHGKRAEIERQGDELVAWIERASGARASADPLTDEILRTATTSLVRAHEREWGGFGGAPKFPQPMTLEFLLRMHARGHPDALDVVRTTLDRMARGGIFDQVGGGFHRYAVDHRWLVPHFEKMLYDNAQLLRLYARAWQVTGEPLWHHTAISVGDYLLREMRHADGGFFASQDADSEGEEGRFYVWDAGELAGIAGEDAALAAAAWGVTEEGNFEGANVLWRPRPDDEVAAEGGATPEELRAAVARARLRLFEAREHRVRPATDDKVLAAWNGLAIAALAEAGRILGREDWVRAAADAAGFVLTALRPEGRLLRAWRDGRTSGHGYLDDHAMMADACLTLYETTFEPRWWDEARALARAIAALFADAGRGGFFDTGSDAPQTVVRPKDLHDNALPSGNAAAADVLLRIAALAGEPDLERAAEGFLRIVAPAMTQQPAGFGHALGALDRSLARATEIAIVGDPGAADTRALVTVALGRFLPNRVIAVGPEGAREPALLRDRPRRDGHATAYVCRDFVCTDPVVQPEALAARLS